MRRSTALCGVGGESSNGETGARRNQAWKARSKISSSSRRVTKLARSVQ
jgi:hypothetical protein